MESHKSVELQKSAVSKNSALKKFWRSFEDFKAEFGRIQWSDEAEILKTARIVVISTFVSGLVLYGADLVVRNVLQGLAILFRMIVA